MYDQNVSIRRRRIYRIRQRRKRKVLLLCLISFLLGFLSGRLIVAAEHLFHSAALSAAAWISPGPTDLSNHPDNAIENIQVSTFTQSESDGWNLMLVNRDNPIPSDFTVTLSDVGDGHQVDQRMAPALLEMLSASKQAGYDILIVSSYRTMEKQTQLYEQKVEYMQEIGYTQEEAEEEAGKIVAVPGTSEHQLGLAIDLVSADYTMLDEQQEQTASYRWLVQHCAEYGFILRYPNGKNHITGIIYEPWHFRYVGKEIALEIMEQEICLEEYLESH